MIGGITIHTPCPVPKRNLAQGMGLCQCPRPKRKIVGRQTVINPPVGR